MKSSQANVLRWAYWFGQVDSRPLSLFRIGFSLLLFKNALYLLPLAHLFYSDAGIVPRAQFWPDPAQVGLDQFSILNYVGTSWGVMLLFGAWAGIALALLLGYCTRAMTILNYLFWLSLVQRNPFSLHAPDHVLLLLSFWALFLPLSHSYSIDAWLARRRQQPLSHTTYAFPLRMIQLQVALIYLFTSYYKWQGLFWRTGDGLFYTFQQTSFLLPTGVWLGLHAPLWLLRWLTWFTLLIEASFPFLVFAPVFQPWAKATGLFLAALFHLGIAGTMAIPDFSIVMLTSYLFFFEPGWVVWLEAQLHRLLRRPPPPIEAGEVAARQSEKHRWRSVVGQAALTMLLMLFLSVALWGGLDADKDLGGKLGMTEPNFIQAINRQLHLASPWSMFAYHAVPRMGWIMIHGQFENSAHQLFYSGIDLASGQTNWQWGPGARLRMFEQRLLWVFPEPILRAWGSYYCRLYNGLQTPSSGLRLVRVEIYRRYHWAHTAGAPPHATSDDLLWRHQCIDQ